jgi:hypothetical protein
VDVHGLVDLREHEQTIRVRDLRAPGLVDFADDDRDATALDDRALDLERVPVEERGPAVIRTRSCLPRS